MRALVAAALALLMAPGLASAQCEAEPDPEPAVRAAARPHYRAGIEASRAERWMEARDSFQRAADIVPLSPILYNLATAQGETGMLVEATENYRHFLRRCTSRQTPELREEAEQLLSTIAPRLGHLVIEVENLASVDSVTIDGRTITPALLGTSMPANPGDHEIRVLRQDVEIATRLVDVREGASETLRIRVDAYVPPDDGGAGGGGGGGGDDIGLIVGLTIGGVLLAGGAAALVTFLVLDGQSGVDLPPGAFGRAAQVPLIEF